MKTRFLTVLIVLSFATVAFAHKPEIVTLHAGQQKKAGRGEITIKFLSVEEDSRCPDGAACVWAGNAKVKVKIGYRKGDAKIFEMNTNMGPKGDQFGGWAIDLTSLTPAKRAGAKTRLPYTATFSVTRLTR